MVGRTDISITQRPPRNEFWVQEVSDALNNTSLLTQWCIWDSNPSRSILRNRCFVNIAHNGGPKFYKETNQEVGESSRQQR